MVVTPEEKKEMEKFMNIMSGSPVESSGSVSSHAAEPAIEADMAYNTEDVKEMKTILEKFSAAQGSNLDQRPRRPVERQSPPTGRWIYRESSKGRYCVENRQGDLIARDLLVKESAVALTKMLNRGKSINDMGVVKLLALEQKYKSDVRKVTQEKTETGLAEARRTAMTTRNDIRSIAESL